MSELLAKAVKLREAQKSYMEARANDAPDKEVLGKRVGEASAELDQAILNYKPTDTTNFNDVLVSTAYLLFALTLYAGVAYLVQFYNWSAWTFVGAIFFIPRIRTGSAALKKD